MSKPGMRDVLYSLRQFSKAPAMPVLAVLCLALGIGVNASIFTVLNSLFLRPLPVVAPERLVILNRGSAPMMSYPDFRDFRERTVTLEGMAASLPTESSLDFDGVAHNAGAEGVSIDYAKVVGVRPYLGRWFQSEDGDECVIGYRAWKGLFAGDENIVGKRVRSETQFYTIVGVGPREFQGTYLPITTDVWVPLRHWMKQHAGMEARMNDPAQPAVFIFGRLKPGVAPSQVSAEINAIAAQRPRDQKPTPVTAELVRGIPNANSRRGAAPIAAVLMAVVGVILLIACVNVGNLLLARGAARRREISIRVALGARRARLLRQLLTESLLLAIAGGLVGVLFAYWTNRALELLLAAGPFESISLDLGTDRRVLLFIGLLSLGTTLLFGLAPAWRASQVDVLGGLKDTGPAPSRIGLRRVSLIAQVSLSLMLMLTAGLFLRVMGEFRGADPGFLAAHRVYASIYASAPEFTPESARAFYGQVTDRLRAVPGVRAVALTNLLPLTPIPPGCAALLDGEGAKIPVTSSTIGPGFLNTIGAPVILGRDFRASEPSAVVIVNEAMAKRLWPKESALGKHLQFGCRTASTVEMVGVARDLRFVSVGEPAKPHIYRPYSNYDGLQTVVLDTAGVVPDLPKFIASVNASARVYAVRPLAEWVDRSFWQVRWEVSILSAFAALALLLSAVGLYGMIAYHVTLKRREIGVRMALGARQADFFQLILRQGLGATFIGIGIGLALSALLTRALAKLLYGVSPTDAPTYLGASLLWVVVAGAACYLPARRASRVEPTEALRYE